MLIQMPATYLCKSVFSYLCEIKSRKRSSITHIDPLMRGTIEKEIIPRFVLMANNMQQQTLNIISSIFLRVSCNTVV